MDVAYKASSSKVGKWDAHLQNHASFCPRTIARSCLNKHIAVIMAPPAYGLGCHCGVGVGAGARGSLITLHDPTRRREDFICELG